MTEGPPTRPERRSSWQTFSVDGVDEACMARALGLEDENGNPADKLPEAAAKELERLLSKQFRRGRLLEISRLKEEFIALHESERELHHAHDAHISRVKEITERITLALDQAKDPRREGP